MKSSLFNISSGGIWITAYFAANLVLTIHNKWVLQKLAFKFPWILTSIHIGISGIGSYILSNYLEKKNEGSLLDKKKVVLDSSQCCSSAWDRFLVLVAFSLLYTINIAISNVSMNYVSLAFHQILRSASPLFTVIIELLFLNKHQPTIIYISLIPVMVGIVMATMGEYSDAPFDWIGASLTFLGVLLSVIKGIVTNMLMVGGKLVFTPLQLITKLAPLAVFQCLIYSWFFGEFDGLAVFIKEHSSVGDHLIALDSNSQIALKLFLNGLLALALNVVSFTANKKTSALSMTVAGNVKQAMLIILAIWIFSTTITFMNGLGIAITLVGGAWYSALTLKSALKPKISTLLPKTNQDLIK